MAWKKTSASTVLLALRDWVVSQTGLDDTRVIITVLDAEATPRFGAPQDILLRPLDESPEVGIIDGAGRFDNRRRKRFQVCVRTRLLLDSTGQDYTRLTDASLGHTIMEDAVVDALELYWPSDGSDALCSPVRVGKLSDPKRIRDDPDWVWSGFDCDFEYTRDLNIASRY